MTALTMNVDDLPDDEFEDAEDGAARPWVPWIAGLTAAIAVFGAAWLALTLSGADRIREVQIEGMFERVPAAEIETAIEPFLDRSLANFDLDGTRAAIESIPWVSRARVERVWPDRLRLRIWERQPFAYWGDGELLDIAAERFRPEGQLPAGLPALSGPEGAETMVAETFRQLAARLAGSAFELVGLSRDRRGEWTARTVADVELRFGRNDPVLGLEVLLGPAQQALHERMPEVAYVDLRYTNGFSVGWRPTVPKAKSN